MIRIPLQSGMFALISEADRRLAAVSWWAVPSLHTYYACRKEGGVTTYLHRVVAGAKTHFQVVDHINHDGLDNRRDNLRIIAHAENMRNQRKDGRASSSGKLGVFFRTDTERWIAHIDLAGRHKSLGSFDTVEEAEGARREAEAAWWGGARDFLGADPKAVARRRAPNRSSATGTRGVSPRAGGRWAAYIGGGKNRIHLGVFPNFEDALAARRAAEEREWG